MKALLFIDSLTGAGAQRQLVNLAVGLTQRGHDITVTTYVPLDFFLDELNKHGITYRCFGKSHRFDLSPVRCLLGYIKKHQPDLIIAFLRTPAIYAELAKLLAPKIPLIVSERAGVEANAFTLRDWLAGAGHLLATRVTANSHDYLNRLVAALPLLKKKSSVIYNGIDKKYFHQGSSRVYSHDTIQNNSSFEFTRFCVVANRANRQKAPMQLVKALVVLKLRGIVDFSIDWIGPVEFSSELVRQVNATLIREQLTTRWHWRGQSNDTAEIYPHYDAFLLPSVYEGVANTLCEAMSCATPVIATDIADNRKILESSHSGILCKPDCPESLADAMQLFIKLPMLERKNLSRAAYERSVQLFSMENFLDSWESLCYDSIASR